MKKVFVDTAAWLALINNKDYFHDLVVEIRKKLKVQGYYFVTTDFVFLEVADALNSPKFRQQTINFINRLRNLPDLFIIPVSSEIFFEGWNFYCQRLDKDWGLTDCISFVVMQREGITEAFTTDKHFEQAGFIRLIK
ncbi:type II toxin-antitoxin system VapC family toxin [Geminocystis sp. CENA526]|uniref:type II toxin-antitoxin system VapC family toxin n=1 Tax=Geminocystis sp. CENA526 TaxID=1355871 RepID=UPI003D6F860E